MWHHRPTAPTAIANGPYLLVVPLVHDVVEMVPQGGFVGGCVGDAFAEIEHEGGETCGGEVDFLVVGDLADRA